MPAPPLSNTFEGGTDGVALTQANSGGASGDAMSSAPTDPNAIQKFTTAQSAHGGVSMTIAQTASAASTRWEWTGFGSLTTDTFFRTYLRVGGAGQIVFAGVRTNAAALTAEIFIDGAGIVTVHNAAGAVVTALTGSIAMPNTQWVRFEFRVLSSTTAGQFEWKRWDTMDDTGTPTETKSATGLVLGANTDQIRWGQVTNSTANLQSWHDDVAVSSVTWLGPASSTIPHTTTFQPVPFIPQGRNF